LVDRAIALTTERSLELGGSAVMRLLILEAILFVDTAELAAIGYERGLARAAYALHSNLFEFLIRARAYAQGVVDAGAAWKVSMIYRVAEDERQAGAGKRSAGVEADFERWKAAEQVARPSDLPFEKIIELIYDMKGGEDQKLVYRAYRRPKQFAHGTLGTVDDVFESGEGADSIADQSRTIDPDAQLIVIASLAHDFAALLNDQFALGLQDRLDALRSELDRRTEEHNARRRQGR
jgi:hypothetical protein